MANWLDWLRHRGVVRTRPVRPLETFRTVSLAEDASVWGHALGSFVRLPNDTPFFMLGVYRFLRDAIPDVSDGVWTWKRLCQTGYDTEILEASSEVAKRRAERLLHDLDVRVNSGDRGMDGVELNDGSRYTKSTD